MVDGEQQGAAPFRWDLIAPDRLGSMLGDTEPPDLWFLDDLVACAGKVLARSANGDLLFVGRSLDSMFDFLGGALEGTSSAGHLARVPTSFARTTVRTGRRSLELRPLSPAETSHVRDLLGEAGASPHALERRKRPAVFVDVVDTGSTFTDLFEVLEAWATQERVPWKAVRRAVRFLGVTPAGKTSPKTYRWHQHSPWTRDLPASAVLNVSLDPAVWSYFGDHQAKLTRSHQVGRWLDPPAEMDRSERTRAALAEAVAIVARGRSAECRRALARATVGEPARAQGWLRGLVTELSR